MEKGNEKKNDLGEFKRKEMTVEKKEIRENNLTTENTGKRLEKSSKILKKHR